MKLFLYTPILSLRLQYTINIVFNHLLQINCEITTDKSAFRIANLAKINYSDKRLTEVEIFIPRSTLLFEKSIQRQNFQVSQQDGLPTLFHLTYPKADFSFDLFAMVFYLLSRYEEYLPFTADRYGRFTSSQSIAFKANFLQQPIINQWVIKLKKTIKQKFKPFYFPPSHSFTFLPTYDIDMAWAYRHKGLIRTVGGFVKEAFAMEWRGFIERTKVCLGIVQDPFYTFNQLDDWHQLFGLSPIYFILLGDYHQFDTNISHKRNAFRQLIYTLHKQYQIGLHPSFQSNFSKKLIHIEKKRLEDIIQNKVSKSRQHFLKLHLPTTYRQLIKAGITEDYSMGYANNIGFRAGIASPFLWYDLEEEKSTSLMIYPFQVMDVSLRRYLKLSPQNALEVIKPLIHSIKKVDGTFTSIWHNSSFAKRYGWEAWEDMYVEMLKFIEGLK